MLKEFRLEASDDATNVGDKILVDQFADGDIVGIDERIDRPTAEVRFLEGKQPGGQFVRPESASASMSFSETNSITSCPRFCSTSATAMPGKRCPPVPPHAITAFMLD